MNKQTSKIDYSLNEAKQAVDSYIDESALRLQKKLKNLMQKLELLGIRNIKEQNLLELIPVFRR